MRTARWLLLVLLAAAGCGDGNDPEILRDCGCITPHDLVARWHAVPSTEDEEPEPAFLEFVTDGTAIFTNTAGNTASAQWSAEAELLTLTYEVDDAPPQTETSEFVVTPDGAWLLLEAALPQGAVDGVVGTWVGHHTNTAGATRTSTLVLAADGTGHRTEVVDGGEPFELDITWEQPAPDELVTTGETAEGMNLVGHARVIPGVGIGGELFERADP